MTVTSIPAPQSVERMFAVLEQLSSQPQTGASLTELARAIDAPKTSLMSLLAGMVASGHLIKDEYGCYRLGARMYSLSMRIVGSLNLATLARPILEELMRATGETVLLGAVAPSGDLAMYIDKIESTSALRYTVSLGEQRDLYSSAIGKLLLAYMPKEQQDAYLQAHELRAFTPATISSRAELRKQLDAIRSQGYALTAGERIVGADAVAAPVVGFGGNVIAGVVIAGPSERMRSHRPALIEQVIAAAARLSRSMSSPERLRPAA
jgi:DNA-binding IclR family transcriptional regulator